MGNAPSLPFPCWENILSYLGVFDVQNLMEADENIRRHLMDNRFFWIKRARRIYEIDPTLFPQFARVGGETVNELFYAVTRANFQLQRSYINVSRNDPTEEIHIDMGHEAVLISVDQKKGFLALHLSNLETRIYALSDLRAGPLRTLRLGPLKEMLIQGDTLFLRTTPVSESYHTTAYNWRIVVDMPGFRPGANMIYGAPLKISQRYLMAWNKPNNAALVYPLSTQGYKDQGTVYSLEPHVIVFPVGHFLHDYAINESTIYAIFASGGAFIHMDFSVPDGITKRAFHIAMPLDLFQPRLAFPYVMVNQRPFNGDGMLCDHMRDDRDRIVFGGKYWIPASYPRMERNGFVVAGDMVETPTSTDYFMFVRNHTNGFVKVLRLADENLAFRVVDTFPLRDSTIIACCGLAYFYTNDRILVLRRFQQDDPHAE